MAPCDNRQPDSCKGHFAIVCVHSAARACCLRLGTSLQAFSLPRRAGASEAIPIAKLLSERERPSDTAQHCDLSQCDLHAAALAVTVALMPRPTPQTGIAPPRRESVPVPSRTLALKGPSLRRPLPRLSPDFGAAASICKSCVIDFIRTDSPFRAHRIPISSARHSVAHSESQSVPASLKPGQFLSERR
jgi:hypothetical protein